MAEYRAYAIGADGHIVKSAPLIRDDDNQAIEEARNALENHKIELWSGERLVARLNTGR
jgi:hypothetical protein